MNECPTRVRTGTPPCSRMISGTAREVIRLWMIVAPGALASSRAATSAVIALGDTAAPSASTTKQRSASPSKARPMSAPTSTTLALQVDQVGRLQRVGLVVGERAVELEVQRDDGQRQRRQYGVAQHRRHGVAAHPVAGVDDDRERADAA